MKGSVVGREEVWWRDRSVVVEEKGGGWESRRMASRMVGWKSPPWGEWWIRCVGRVWPSVQKRSRALYWVALLQLVAQTRGGGGLYGRKEGE